MPAFNDLGEITPGRVRVREMKKDLFFGNIVRGDKRQLKWIDINNEAPLVVQVS